MPRPRVCAYDGRCYRKNPQHFRDYAHPVQYPSPADAPAPSLTPACNPPITTDVDDAHEADRKRARAEDVNVVVDGVDTPPSPARSESPADVELQDTVSPEELRTPPAAAEAEAEVVDESAPASPEQLVWFLRHAPSLHTVMPATSGDTEGRGESGSVTAAEHTPAALPHLDGATWAGVVEVLRLAYPSLGFHATDVRCVLMAASALRPDCPLLAFPGWQLVGPFELAWRYAQLCCCGDDGESGGGDEAERGQAVSGARRMSGRATVQSLLCGCTAAAEEEVRRWRCARFRYDPPECQTVAVRVRSPAADGAAQHTATSGAASAAVDVDAGLHLCYHRDDPTDVPGMLVCGTAQAATFSVANHRGWLAPYLCAWAQSRADASQPVATAYASVTAAVGAALDRLADSAPLRAMCAQSLALQGADAARRKRRVASTLSGLGLWVPVQADTDVGYRVPNIPARVSLAACLRDGEAAFVAAARGAVGGHGIGSHGSGDDAGDGGRPPASPPSRSVQHEQLARASPCTARSSEALDDIFLCADIANDEGDCGTSLELGLNCMACVLADQCVVPSPARAAATRGGSSSPLVDPVLWHTYRLLDCAYMLLNRPLYRHILRCHLAQLADASRPVPLTLLNDGEHPGGLQRFFGSAA